MLIAAFAPLYQNTLPGLVNSLTITTGVAAASGTLTGTAGTQGQLRIVNTASVFAYVNFGPSTVVAATVANSMPIAPNSVEVFTIDPNVTTVSAILGSGTGTLICTRGEGV
jgi:hypothetical protein